MTAAALRALLLRCDAVAPACARPALAVALRSLDGDASVTALRDAAADLRAAYERAAPPRAGCARHEHADRFRAPWADPCDDPAELRPLAACVAAVYAAEAAATGERASRVEHYQRAAEGWL